MNTEERKLIMVMAGHITREEDEQFCFVSGIHNSNNNNNNTLENIMKHLKINKNTYLFIEEK
jgi:hypothetical protein